MQGLDFVTGSKFCHFTLISLWGCFRRLGLLNPLFFYTLCRICRDPSTCQVSKSEIAADLPVSKQEKYPLRERFLAEYSLEHRVAQILPRALPRFKCIIVETVFWPKYLVQKLISILFCIIVSMNLVLSSWFSYNIIYQPNVRIECQSKNFSTVIYKSHEG